MSSLFTFSSFSVADARGKSFFNSLLSWSMYLKWTSQNLKIQEDSLPQWHIHVISVCTFAKHTCTMFPILQTKFFTQWWFQSVVIYKLQCTEVWILLYLGLCDDITSVTPYWMTWFGPSVFKLGKIPVSLSGKPSMYSVTVNGILISSLALSLHFNKVFRVVTVTHLPYRV